MLNLTSAGQFAGLNIMHAGGGLIEMALSQFVINLRYSLMSISLSQKVDHTVRGIYRWAVAFGNTDEIFAVSVGEEGGIGKKFFYGLMLFPWIGWSSGTIIGAIAGSALPEIITGSLGVAIYAMLIAVVIPKAKTHFPTALCALLAVVLSCAFKYLPILSDFAKEYAGFVIIICAVIASAVFALLFPVNEDKEASENDR
jgi:predicted branched-subunit amino acid permease